MSTIGVIVFPGSNCDHDVLYAYERVVGKGVVSIWHTDTTISGVDAVVLPGGFSYGDYLRTGALATLSPIMGAIKRFAAEGGAVIGICNGFQILCEAGLLPGVLLQNAGMRFISKFVSLRVEQSDTPFTKGIDRGAVITCPVAHFDGNFFASPGVIEELERDRRVIFRYCTPSGEVNAQVNPNGSLKNIAGICNAERNVVGLMPHPERSIELLVGGVGGASGLDIFRSL